MRLGDAIMMLAGIIGGLVTASEFMPPKLAAATVVPVKKIERPVMPEISPCASETWPNISASCLRSAEGDKTVGTVRWVIPDRG